jgi:hypothetical protein
MSNVFINSPFAGLARQLYTDGQTGAASSATLSDIAAQSNPLMIQKQQALNRGVGRNLFATVAGQGSAAAARAVAPIAQSLSDRLDNVQYGMQQQQANEGFANNLMSRLFMNQAQNDNPAYQQRRASTGINLMTSMMSPDGLMGSLFNFQ